jgi:hypothetical protein
MLDDWLLRLREFEWPGLNRTSGAHIFALSVRCDLILVLTRKAS